MNYPAILAILFTISGLVPALAHEGSAAEHLVMGFDAGLAIGIAIGVIVGIAGTILYMSKAKSAAQRNE